MPRETAVTEAIAALRVVGAAPAPVNNPANLRPHFLRNVGEGIAYTPEQALRDFGENPFLAGSPQFEQYQTLTREAREASEKRFLAYPDVPIVLMPSKRRLSQPTLKLPFQTLHDIRMRLQSGYVFIGTNLYYVTDIRELEGDYLLLLKNGEDQVFKCWYNKTGCIDLRTPEPQYITDDNQPGFFFRPPLKQQRQAINHDNSYIRYVGRESANHCHPLALVKGLSREALVWKPMIYDLMTKARAVQSLRLSKDLAVYRNPEEKLIVDYRGRRLGELKEDVILCNEMDAKKNWIHRDVSMIGCSLRGMA